MLATSSRISRPCLQPSRKLTRSGEREYTRLAFAFACRDDDYGINCREEGWNLCIFHIASSAWSVQINARPEYLPGLNIADLHFSAKGSFRLFINYRSESIALGLPRTTLSKRCRGVRCPFASTFGSRRKSKRLHNTRIASEFTYRRTIFRDYFFINEIKLPRKRVRRLKLL